MKKLLFVLLLFISNSLYSQQYYEAKTFSFCTIKRNERWSEWTPVDIIKAAIEVDSADGTIVLYTNRVATYSIYKTERFINDGEIIYWFYCEDDFKVLCNIQLILDKNGLNKNEMEIRYADLKLRYELK